MWGEVLNSVVQRGVVLSTDTATDTEKSTNTNHSFSLMMYSSCLVSPIAQRSFASPRLT